MNNTNARFVKNVNERQKLWQLPSGKFVLTSFSENINPSETMAFEAWEGGGVKNWDTLGVIVDEHPRHETLIERILLNDSIEQILTSKGAYL